ncbi:MAG: energy transducer TonB [Sphingopyxis sp.]|nr:energy transducer TonB [Sphingopyxis sp.]
MSLLPLLLGRLSHGPVVAADVGGGGRYDPRSSHRPLLALAAVGLPAAMLVAVALSPFEMPKVIDFGGTTVISIPKPVDPPPPDPKADPVKPVDSAITTVSTLFKPIVDNPVKPIDDIIVDYTGPVIGTEQPTDPAIESTPTPPLPLVEAKLDPRYAGTFQPDYPAREQREGIEGTSRVRVLVGTDGRVKAVEDVATTSSGFFTETKRRALSKWRFKPATRGGAPEESWFTITVRFQLND